MRKHLTFNKLFKMSFVLFFSLFIVNCSNSTETVKNINTPNVSSPVEIYLIDSLDDSRKYCLDILGYKDSADINKGLQSHSCYSYQGAVSIDQGFDKELISEKEFYIPHFKVCMEAENIEESSGLALKTCDKNEKQKFILQSSGKINPESNLNLCLTVSSNSREGGGGNPVHLIRDLSLQTCDESLSSFQNWGTRTIN